MTTEPHERGLARRKDKTVDKFTAPFQEVINEYVGGAVWARPGLETRTRCLLTIGMLTALNRPHELKLHIKAAINNGLTQDEIGEVLLQTAVYCGVAAAEDSFRIAREAFQEIAIQQGKS